MKNLLHNIYVSVVGTTMYLMILVFVFTIFYPLSLCAQEVAAPPPMPSTEPFFEAITNQHWPLAVALGVTILVWFVRYVIKDKIPIKIIPYVMVACTVLSAAAARIIQAVSDNQTWWTAMIQGILEGLTVGLGSMGMWSAGMKNALPTPKRE